ncbi:hypothetical protein ACTWP5_27735 [Streptomyces sp. 4N509B]|uniref:hypothetical protein n=1 Tax=Streptomyces sp. 4N509B TaxID=3457413 RepID=UPI003FD1D97B
MATSQITGVPSHASTPSPDVVRARVGSILAAAVTGQSATTTQALLNAVTDGIEDAAVVARGTDRTETGARYDHRLGQLLAHDLDRLFQAAVEDAVERGSDPRQATSRLASLLFSYASTAAEDAVSAFTREAVAA